MTKEFGISFAIMCFCLQVTVFGVINGQGFTTAPLNVKVSTLGDDDIIAAEITVTWKPPLQVNGSILGYTVMYSHTDNSDSNHTVSTGPQALSANIHNLLFYTNYTIYVRAQTDLGNGDWSSPVIFWTRQGTANDVCEVTKVYSPTPTTIFISWKELPPENHRGILTSYRILWLPVGVTNYAANYRSRVLPLSVRNFTITKLKPFMPYYLGVVAVNGAGFFITETMAKRVTVARTIEDVPSRPPSNLNARFICDRYELEISWLPLANDYTNGILRSYKVLVYQGETLYKDVSVTSEKTTSLVSLDECRNYTVVLAAVTTPGAGPNITTDAISSCPCGPPQPLHSKRILVAGENQSFTLPCEYKGRPEPTVYWVRNGQRLRGNTKAFNISKVNGNTFDSQFNRVSKQLTNGSWYVSHAEIQDSGNYACVLNSTFGQATSIVTLNVAKDFATVKFGLTLINKTFHEDLKNSRSEMFLKFSSYITQQIIKLFSDSDKRFSVKVIEVLQFRKGSVIADMEAFATVDDPTFKDSAADMIKSTLLKGLSGSQSSLGNLSVSTLVVQAPPPSPDNLKATETKQARLQFSWSPPKFHDAYVITGYSLQYRKKGEGNMTSTKLFPASQYYGVINGLLSDTSYEVIVVAHNNFGTGSSESIMAKTADWTTIIILSTVIPTVVMFVVLTLLMVWRNKAQRKKKEQLEAELHQMKEERILNETFNNYEREFKNVGWTRTYLESISWRQWWEIPRDSLQVGDQLGSGAFGEVKKGVLTNGNETVVCAIKMLKKQATEVEHRDLVNELNIMASVGEHPNIVSLIGACTTDGPLWLVVKFAENGNLLSYLHSHRENISEGYENIVNTKTNLNHMEKLHFAYGIARGMHHLEKKKCVHRDLAARNVLLGENNRPMVSDFGLSRDIYESGQYEKTTGGKLPVRWMAIESLEDYIYTKQSDVWSYGVVLWEIESGGRVPYPGLNGMELLSKLKSGYRLERPGGCSLEIYHIMCKCWATDPSDRPSFENLEKRIEKLLEIEGYEEIFDAYHMDIHQPSLTFQQAYADKTPSTKNSNEPGVIMDENDLVIENLQTVWDEKL